MSTFVKFAIATALVTVTTGLAQAQQGRSIQVIPAQTAAPAQAVALATPTQNFAPAPVAQAPVAQADVAEAPVAEAPADVAEQAPEVAPQAAPAQPARVQTVPVHAGFAKPAHRPVEKCHDDKPVYTHYAPRYEAPRYHAPRYEAPRAHYAPRAEYAPTLQYAPRIHYAPRYH